MRRTNKWVTAVVLIAWLGAPCDALCFNPVLGSRASAMGTAFVAIADDPSAIAYNPAGLPNVKGTQLYGGASAIIIHTDYTSPSGATETTINQVFTAPHLYLVSDLKTENTAFGVGIYSPYGIGGRKWSEGGLTRYASTENIVGTVAVNPSVGWRPLPWLSVGAGISYLRAQSTAENMINQSALGAPDAKLSMKGDGGGWGYNMGLMFYLGEGLSLGLAYRSGIRVEQDLTLTVGNIAPVLQPLFGGSQFKTDATTVLHMPQLVSAGLAYRPTRFLTLSAAVDWVGWSSFDKMDIALKNEVPAAGLTSMSTPLNYRDVWQFKLGAEYSVNDRFSLRCGYAYIQSFVPEQSVSPGNPDSDQNNFMIGFGYRKDRWTLDAFYMADIYMKRTVSNNILSGSYDSITHVAGLSIGYVF
jgi:long-chain fatty acid transport protein